LVRRFRAKKKILVVNKADLPARIDKDRLRAAAGKTPVVEISALRGTNMTGLKEEIRRSFAPPEESLDEVILHSRQRDLLREALTALRKARRLLGEGRPEEVVAEELREAASLIGHLTGEIRADEVIEAVFSRFCVGK
jgi:tRNA modification GTPase